MSDLCGVRKAGVNNPMFFESFDHVAVLYDHGQTELGLILPPSFFEDAPREAQLAKTRQQERLITQVANMICDLEVPSILCWKKDIQECNLRTF